MKRLFALLGLLWSASACVMMPPAPSGRALLRGQNESSFGMAVAYRPAALHRVSIDQTAFGERVTREAVAVSQLGLFPSVYSGRSYGVSRAGTEWGWQFGTFLEPALYLRQALRRPVDPRATAWALQFDSAYGIPDLGSLSLALAASKRFGRSGEGTLALRGGTERAPVWVPGGWGPGQEGIVATEFVDVSLRLGGAGALGRRVSVEGLLRFPLRGAQRIREGGGRAGDTTYRYWSDVELGPSFMLAIRRNFSDFTTYAAQAVALPRRWTVRRSPDTLPPAQRLRFAEGLALSGMVADAADEYQQALREDPQLHQAHAPLAELYLGLAEPELAHYHAQRALQTEPASAYAQELVARARRALEAGP